MRQNHSFTINYMDKERNTEKVAPGEIIVVLNLA